MKKFFDRWSAFIGVTLALGLGISTASMPTPLYPLYQAAWQIPPSSLSYIFSAYMLGVMVSLLCLGRLSESFGRFRVIVAALLMISVGMLLSTIADGPTMLICARAIIGLANGMLTTAGAMAIVESHPTQDKRFASVITSMSITTGFGAGTVISGVVAQPGVAPLVLPYIVMLLLVLMTLALIIKSRPALQGPPGLRARLSVSPRMAIPKGPHCAVFFLACMAGLITFTIGSLFASLVPPLLQKLLPWKGPAVIGMAFFFMVGASIVTQLSQRNMPAFKGLALGMFAFVAALATLAIGLFAENVPALIASVLFTGVGQGYGFMNSGILAGSSADEHRRAANMSTYFLAAYMGATVPVICVGLLADRLGLTPAILVFCAVVACMVIALGMLAMKYSRQSSAAA